MIDTHAHLYAKDFDIDIDEVICRAIEVGVTKILLPNIDENSIAPMDKLVNDYPRIFKKMMGLHPCSVGQNYLETLDSIKKQSEMSEHIAVGEIGMDLYWDTTYRKQQEDAFLIQCQWALESNLPIAIHARDATDILIDIIKTHFGSKLTGVFHCFGGTEKQAKAIVGLNMYVGIGGVVTFKNSGLKGVLPSVPLERVLVETDAPYLAPVPYRGRRNESAYVVEVVKALASIYEEPVETINKISTNNALKLFKL